MSRGDALLAGTAAPGPPPHPLPDQADRDAIRTERERNLLVVAGAGTGKTTSVVDRVVAFVAPDSPAHRPVEVERLAVITFTRRAAGELRFRVRERLLEELAGTRPGSARGDLLRRALSALDAAAIGTIHSFADRLLKLRPVEARLSPAYALAEESQGLVAEAFRRLRRGAETDELAAELAGGSGPAARATELAAEAAETLRAAIRGGLQMERVELPDRQLPSMEDIVSRMIETRDVPLALPEAPSESLEPMRAALRELEGLAPRAAGPKRGHRHVREAIHQLRRLESAEDVAEAFAILKAALARLDLGMERDFGGDCAAWQISKALRGQRPSRGSVVPADLGFRLTMPYRWLAKRIVRLAPVVGAMYERIKEEHEVVDFVDLLLKLRDLMRDRPEVRRFYQGLFDHIFVDEFQDTDPLQCEVLFYLGEDGAEARAWHEVRLRPGRLTLVGDPKQSIYRFRRADVTTYGTAEAVLRAQGARVCTLSTNFRSRPELVSYFNQELAEVLGTAPAPGSAPRGRSRRPAAAPHVPPLSSSALDAATGQAYYEPLAAAPSIPAAPGGRPVHVLPYAGSGGEPLTVKDGGREIEAEVIARYLRWLLASGAEVRDPATDAPRPVRPGDVAILAPVTTSLDLLLERLDQHGIEHSIRGGTLLLSHPLVRRYLLALRSLADRDDGVAEAALLSPPFFALDAADRVVGLRRVQAAAGAAIDASPELAARRARLEAALAIVRELRAARHRRPPGATARLLIERTGLGRAALAGPNGRQTLAALYQVAFEIEQRALEAGLDFDAATVLPRSWADIPVYLDLPEPLGNDAVRVTTVHGAKGLEFPVVVIWDGFQVLGDRVSASWIVGRDGRSWALNLNPVSIEEPPDAQLLAREREFSSHERRRLYYVAATRARDLVVLPLPATRGRLEYATALLAGAGEDLVRRFEPFRPDAMPEWAQGPEAAPRLEMAPIPDPELDRLLAEAGAGFEAALARALLPRSAPRAVTEVARARGEARADISETVPEPAEARAAKAEESRFGRSFGVAVHRALELAVGGSSASPEEAVEVALAETALDLPAAERAALAVLRGDVLADVRRALAALDTSGLARLELAVEVDITAPRGAEVLLRGAIDLLAVGPDAACVIDWKTDTPVPGRLAAAYPVYAAQLRLYLEALRASGLAGDRGLRAGLLFTASGELRWLDP